MVTWLKSLLGAAWPLAAGGLDPVFFFLFRLVPAAVPQWHPLLGLGPLGRCRTTVWPVIIAGSSSKKPIRGNKGQQQANTRPKLSHDGKRRPSQRQYGKS